MEQRLTIIMPTHSSYLDVAIIAEKLFLKYWNECPYRIVVSTNEIEVNPFSFFELKNNSESDEFVRRIYNAAKAYPSDYYLIINEDRFLSENMNDNLIKDVLTYLDINNINYCRFIPASANKEKALMFMPISKAEPYGHNLAGCICTFRYIEENMSENINGWVYENNKLEETLHHNKKEFFSDSVKLNIDILHSIHGIRKNKWIKASYSVLKKNNPEIDFDIREIDENKNSNIGSQISGVLLMEEIKRSC